MKADVSEIPRGQLLCETQVIPVSLSRPVANIANLDRLKILAAIGIVWFHLGTVPYRQVAYAGMPVFLLIFFSLIARRGVTTTTQQFVRRRYHRLLKPWLFWSVVYGLCRMTKALLTKDSSALHELLSVQTLVTGTSIHLWYLPYAFASGLLVHKVNRWTWRLGHVGIVLFTGILGGLVLAVHAASLSSHGLAIPLAQWEFGLAAIPLGFAIGRCLAIPSRDLQRRLLAGIAVAILAECAVLYLLGLPSATIPYGVAVALVCLAYSVEIGSDVVVASLTPLTFGVYLLHPLVVYALNYWPAATAHNVLFASLTVSISALIALVLLKTPARSFL